MENRMSYKVSLRLFRGEKCFGPGIAELLEGVEEYSSLRAAAAKMGMAYSKAWRIVGECAAALGYPLLDSTKGGQHGGGATLTKEAKTLLARYRSMEAALNERAGEIMGEWE